MSMTEQIPLTCDKMLSQLRAEAPANWYLANDGFSYWTFKADAGMLSISVQIRHKDYRDDDVHWGWVSASLYGQHSGRKCSQPFSLSYVIRMVVGDVLLHSVIIPNLNFPDVRHDVSWILSVDPWIKDIFVHRLRARREHLEVEVQLLQEQIDMKAREVDFQNETLSALGIAL